MSNICLYLDEDAFQNALVQALRNSDVDVVTVSDVNKLSYSDEEQLIWACEQGRVIYSYNMGDFSRLHGVFLAQGRTHGGIILVPQQRYSIGEQLRGLLRLIADKSAEETLFLHSTCLLNLGMGVRCTKKVNPYTLFFRTYCHNSHTNPTMTYTPPSVSDIFKAELEQTFNIKELEREVIHSEQEIRTKLEKLISPKSSNITLLAEITHLASQAENEKDITLKIQKLEHVKELACRLKLFLEKEIESSIDEANLIEALEISKSYVYVLSGTQKFFEVINFLSLANEFKLRKDKVKELIYTTKAFELLREIVDFYWQYCSLDIRRTLHLSVEQLLISNAFEEKSFISELKLRVQMFIPSLKNFTDIVGAYRKARKEYIRLVLIKLKTDKNLYLSYQKKDKGKKKSNVKSIIKYAENSSGWAGDDFEECLDMVNNLRRL